MSNAHEATKPTLEHIALWAADLEKTSDILTDLFGWRRNPVVFGVTEGDEVFGGMKLAFIDANGFWIELVEPTTEGPGMDFLKLKGNGALVELDFSVPDFDKTVAAMKAKGIDVVGMDGNPLRNGGLLQEWVIKDGKRETGDERLMYLPANASGGTSIELFWEYPTGVVFYRDEIWPEEKRTPRSAPRLDYITVITANLPATEKVYTETLGLKKSAVNRGLSREWMGVSESQHAWIDTNCDVWVELVAPTEHAGQAVLKDPALGDGAILELGVEVADIEAFHDQMAGKGIRVMSGDGVPLPVGQKAVTVSTGDRYCYLPREKTEGMRILIFQRAPTGEGVFAKRNR